MGELYEHRCVDMDDDICITARTGDSGQKYWLMEWNFDDSNDPCYGSLKVKYCPYCGKSLISV